MAFKCSVCGHKEESLSGSDFFWCPTCGLHCDWLPTEETVKNSPTEPPFPRAEDDGRCLICEGWGCPACENTGGY